jgi:hypothetical protein
LLSPAIIYASVASTAENAPRLLSGAIHQFLCSVGEHPEECVRWMLEYQQRGLQSFPIEGHGAYVSRSEGASAAVVQQPNILFLPPSLDLTFDDRCLEHIRAAWHAITGSEDGFMDFEDREQGAYDSEDGDN